MRSPPRPCTHIPAAQEQKPGGASSSDMLKDLAAYLTLEKAQVGRGLMGGWQAAAVHQVAGHLVVAGRRWSIAHTPAGVVLSNQPSALRSPQLQRLYAFSAAQHGITDAQAAEIATVFSAFDSDENGYLSLDEFQRLWWVATSGVPPPPLLLLLLLCCCAAATAAAEFQRLW